MSTNTSLGPPVDTTLTPSGPITPLPSRLALVIDGEVRVPGWVVDAESFRRWTQTPEFPPAVKADWREGTLWLDTLTGPTLSRFKPSLNLPPVPQTGAAVVIDGELWVPTSVVDLESFRQWVFSQEYPKCVRLSYLKGLLWIDRTMEQMYTHNRVKTEVATRLDLLTKATRQGIYLGDGMRLSHQQASLETEPDGLFVSYAALQTGRVRRVPGRSAGVVELEGSPEMVLEVVSDSSVQKDMVNLPAEYHAAGIDEFWRIDARSADPVFEILRWAAAGYVGTQLPDGWWQSDIFGHAFQLVALTDPLGDPLFVLEMR